MSIREQALPELSGAWSAAARDLAANKAIQIGIADEGGTRTLSDTTRILNYREQDYAIYAARERAAGRTPQAMTVWRPINAFGTSFHNFGAARDAKIISRPKAMSYDEAVKVVRAAMARAGLRGISSVNDQLHFELPISLTEAKARWDAFNASSGGTSSGGGGSSGDSSSGGGSSVTSPLKPSGSSLLGALFALAILGGGFAVYRKWFA